LNAPTSGRATRGRQGPRTLVIGCGFIGSHVVAELAGQGRPPVVLTRSLPGKAVAGLVADDDLHLGDAQTPQVLEPALAGVDQVIFSAGGLLPAASEQDPELDERLTLGPVRAVLEALRSRPGVCFTYLSSGGTVYGEPERVPVDEEAPTRAFGAYGRLHLACEREIEVDRAEHGLRARILRCATVYGEHQNPDRGQGVIATFLHRIERGQPLELYGDGSMVRDYVYAGDVARATVALTDLDGGPSVVNVGAGEGTSLLEVLRMAEKQVGRSAEVIRHPQRGFDVHRIVLDTERLHQLVEVEITPLPAGIERTHHWLTARSPELA
jgi:UDP-glucose 4-epimerase